MEEHFGAVLKRFRLRAGFGLRKFAELVELKPSNLSAIEHGRRTPPSGREKLREIADALGLVENTDDWGLFFDTASAADSLPADIAHLANRRLVPVLLRTIDNQQLSDEDIAKLIENLNSRTEDEGDDSGEHHDVHCAPSGEQSRQVSQGS